MAKPLQRAVIGVVVLAALAGGVFLGIWLNGRIRKPAPAEAPATEAEAATNASRLAAAIQKKAESGSRTAPIITPRTADPAAAARDARPTMAHIKGRLVDPQGQPITLDMVVFSPEGRFTLNAVNGLFETDAPPGALRIIGQYRDGVRVAQTAPVSVRTVAGQTVEVALVVPVNEPSGTPGFRYNPDAEFLEVTVVDPGSAAAEAGMTPGDAIIEIGGVAIKDIDPATFAELLNGPPGSLVSVTVVAETAEGMKEFPLQLERRAPVR